MKVLIACEESQVVCKAFRKKGHEAYSCDILPTSGDHPEWHLQMDAIDALHLKSWDLIIAFPPCTFLANSGVRWLYSKKTGFNYDRLIQMENAAVFFQQFVRYAIKTGKKVSIENPIMHKHGKDRIFKNLSVGYMRDPNPDQIIQPWQFGHGETKATCLWLFNLPKLKPTNIVEGREQRIWGMPPSPERQKLRSKTYEGIAKAMADQWG